MRPKTTGAKLPPRMVARRRKLASGKIWIGYYYNGRDEQGKRVEIPLGTDLITAKRKWAELEGAPPPADTGLMKHVFDRYVKDILPKKGVNTQREYMGAIKQLRGVFDDAPINSIKPTTIAAYRDARSAPVRANREIAMLSAVFNLAREWGLTTAENPCRGVRKNKETPRSYYAEDDVWHAVYAAACDDLRAAMDLAYLTGQRPADVRKMRRSDVVNDEVKVRQNKTGQILRIRLTVSGQRTRLGECIDHLVARSLPCKSGHLICTTKGDPLSEKMLRDRYDNARSKAAGKAKIEVDEGLAERIRSFQFRDIRPKAGSEIETLQGASELLGHTNQAITKRVYRRKGELVDPTK